MSRRKLKNYKMLNIARKATHATLHALFPTTTFSSHSIIRMQYIKKANAVVCSAIYPSFTTFTSFCDKKVSHERKVIL